MVHIERILHATDFSPHSNQAYFHAVALAESYGAELTIVYVFTPANALAGRLTADRPREDRDYWRGQLVRPQE